MTANYDVTYVNPLCSSSVGSWRIEKTPVTTRKVSCIGAGKEFSTVIMTTVGTDAASAVSYRHCFDSCLSAKHNYTRWTAFFGVSAKVVPGCRCPHVRSKEGTCALQWLWTIFLVRRDHSVGDFWHRGMSSHKLRPEDRRLSLTFFTHRKWLAKSNSKPLHLTIHQGLNCLACPL